MSIFLHNPLKYLASAIIIKVSIDIWQGHTVRIEKTFKKQVILHRVQTGNAKTVGHYGPCCRTTSRSYPYIQLIACRVDEVLYNKEVTWKSHGLHDMKFKSDTVIHLLGNRITI